MDCCRVISYLKYSCRVPGDGENTAPGDGENDHAVFYVSHHLYQMDCCRVISYLKYSCRLHSCRVISYLKYQDEMNATGFSHKFRITPISKIFLTVVMLVLDHFADISNIIAVLLPELNLKNPANTYKY